MVVNIYLEMTFGTSGGLPVKNYTAVELDFYFTSILSNYVANTYFYLLDTTTMCLITVSVITHRSTKYPIIGLSTFPFEREGIF